MGKSYEPGQGLSTPVQSAIAAAITAVLEELARLGLAYEKRSIAQKPGIWWCEPELGSIAAC